jgi:hypothetical protein
MKNVLYIIRGLPGSGKTTEAKRLAAENPDNFKIYEADDYFLDATSGIYNFDATKLQEAHHWRYAPPRRKYPTGDYAWLGLKPNTKQTKNKKQKKRGYKPTFFCATRPAPPLGQTKIERQSPLRGDYPPHSPSPNALYPRPVASPPLPLYAKLCHYESRQDGRAHHRRLKQYPTHHL